MESNSFKSVAFGGFEKQGVIDYIEKAAAEHAAQAAQLQQENDALRAERDALSGQLAQAQAQLAQDSAARSALEQELEQLRTEAAALRPLPAQVEQLTAEAAALRPDAEAYRQFRNRIGDIECEARRRAAELESTTRERLRRTLTDLSGSYRKLTETFASASGYVTGELRKVEVNLTQLPRALDQMGAELGALEDSVKQQDEK